MRKAVVVCASLLFLAGSAMAQDWVTYTSEKYGFEMLIPAGTKFVETEYGRGWAQLQAEFEGVYLYALTKKGEQAAPEEIEAVGVKVTGIPDKHWKMVRSGEDEAGWNWFRTVEASHDGVLVIGDYGTGAKGSYMLILVTTEDDYMDYEDDYKKWWNSIRLE